MSRSVVGTVVEVVEVVGLRGAGERYTQPPVYELSTRARAIGLVSLRAAWDEYRMQTDVDSYAGDMSWSKGTLWVCCCCESEFLSASGAHKHMQTQRHPVLRWLDVYEREQQ